MSDLNSNEKKVPVLYQKKEECCGCGACYAICPRNAITMTADEEGFLYPKIDINNCVRCYQCLKVCAFKQDQHILNIESDM